MGAPADDDDDDAGWVDVENTSGVAGWGGTNMLGAVDKANGTFDWGRKLHMMNT